CGTQDVDLGQQNAGLPIVKLDTDTLGHVQRLKISVRKASPLGAGEDIDPMQFLRLQLDFPPLGICGQFTPHVLATPKQQGAPNCVFGRMSQVRSMNQRFELVPVAVVLSVIELRLKEFSNDFIFRYSE